MAMDVSFVYWMTDRGIKAILLSCCKTPCPIPFDCKELEFNEGITTLYASVTAGKGSMRVERTVPKTKEEEREARKEKTERMEKRRMTRESRMRLYGPKLEGGMRYMETPHRRSQYDHISSARSTNDSENEHSKDESGKNANVHKTESGGRGKSSSEFSSPNRDHSSSKPHEESVSFDSASNHHESDHKEKSGTKSSDSKSNSRDNSEREEEEKERSEFKSGSENGRDSESGSERDDEHVTRTKDQKNEDDRNESDHQEKSSTDKAQPHTDHDGEDPSQGDIEALPEADKDASSASDKDKSDEDSLHKTEKDKSDEDSSVKPGKDESASEVKTIDDSAKQEASDTSDKSQDNREKEFSSQQKEDSDSSDIQKNSTESVHESKNTKDLDKMSSTSQKSGKNETSSTQASHSHTPNKETDTSNTESQHPQKHIFVVGSKVFGDEIDDETRKRVLKIPKHVKQAVSILYDLPVIRLKLHFIQQGNSLMLQEDSECTTSAKGIRFENDLEARFAEFYLQEYPTKIDMTRCIIGRKNCAEPGCKVPLKLVMLYKAEKRFPEADPGRLMLMVQDRMIDDEDACANCCIRCWHDISTSEHIARCSERETPVLNTPPPRTFQPVVPAELAEKQQLKHPMGMTAKMNTPYSFTLNLHRSPYRLKVPEPRAPPPILKQKLKKQGPIGHPEWVGRLMTWVPKDERILEPLPLSKGLKKPEGPQPRLQEVPEVPHAQERARRFYEKPPFDIKMLDSKRKRKLHRTTEEHYARFSPTARFDSL